MVNKDTKVAHLLHRKDTLIVEVSFSGKKGN